MYTLFFNYIHICAPITKDTDKIHFLKVTFGVFIKQCVTDVLNNFCAMCAVPVGYMKVNPVQLSPSIQFTKSVYGLALNAFKYAI